LHGGDKEWEEESWSQAQCAELLMTRIPFRSIPAVGQHVLFFPPRVSLF
jgi:hypothetical protein